MEHHFNVEIATQYGMLEAVLLNNLYFWIEHNRANDKNYHDGYYWTYNSIKAYAELFPYVSSNKIRNALKRLEEEGLIITGNYNQSAYDRTMWYALTEKGKCIFQKYKMESVKKENGNFKNTKPIPNNKTNNKTNIDIYIQEFCGEDKELTEAVQDFLDMRKRIKKPLTTERAIKMLFKKLEDLSKDKETQVAILNQSVFHDWQSVYELKGEQKKNKAHNFNERNTSYSDIEKLIFNK